MFKGVILLHLVILFFIKFSTIVKLNALSDTAFQKLLLTKTTFRVISTVLPLFKALISPLVKLHHFTSEWIFDDFLFSDYEIKKSELQVFLTESEPIFSAFITESALLSKTLTFKGEFDLTFTALTPPFYAGYKLAIFFCKQLEILPSES